MSHSGYADMTHPELGITRAPTAEITAAAVRATLQQVRDADEAADVLEMLGLGRVVTGDPDRPLCECGCGQPLNAPGVTRADALRWRTGGWRPVCRDRARRTAR